MSYLGEHCFLTKESGMYTAPSFWNSNTSNRRLYLWLRPAVTHLGGDFAVFGEKENGISGAAFRVQKSIWLNGADTLHCSF